MGRIRTDFVKGMSEKLVAALPDRFSGDFAKNKAALAELKITEEKFTQNKIAGYIVRVVKKKKF
jgi:ribosomal protein S17E